MYMSKYGIDNVRGGIYCEITLPPKDIAIIGRQINTTDKCPTCHRADHFARDCTFLAENTLAMTAQWKQNESLVRKRGKDGDEAGLIKKRRHDSQATQPCSSIDSTAPPFILEVKAETRDVQYTRSAMYNSSGCFRCGRKGHWEIECFARTHVNGRILSDFENDSDYDDDYEDYSDSGGNLFSSVKCRRLYKNGGDCYRCGNSSHWAQECYASRDIYGETLSKSSDTNRYKSTSSSSQSGSCYRCGSSSHWAPDCYAKKDVFGDYIPKVRDRSRYKSYSSKSYKSYSSKSYRYRW